MGGGNGVGGSVRRIARFKIVNVAERDNRPRLGPERRLAGVVARDLHRVRPLDLSHSLTEFLQILNAASRKRRLFVVGSYVAPGHAEWGALDAGHWRFGSGGCRWCARQRSCETGHDRHPGAANHAPVSEREH